MASRTAARQFDAGFYRRFYLNPRTRVVTPAEMARRADLVAAFVRHGELPVKSILDVGCGLGLMREQLLRHFPKARYVGLEVSEYLCARHGWEQGSIATFQHDRAFDLVICYDVLQYLDARQAGAALRNLAQLCEGVLHFGVLTQEDWELYCDKRRTDRNVYVRPASWYRRRLARAFINAGSGMFVRRGAPMHLWELDQVEVLRSRRA
jgi:2-polyprenyl-3-methyl-5-hydroxy-6-metoxy-1,4-benzoquinol methylase